MRERERSAEEKEGDRVQKRRERNKMREERVGKGIWALYCLMH